MKSKLIFRRLLVLLPVFAVILFISSCTKEEIVIAPESDIAADVSLKDAHYQVSDYMICDLIAGQNMNVGEVKYILDAENNLHVEYIAMPDWMISEVHLYVGNMNDFEETCINKKAVKIGKFPYTKSEINDDTWSFEISLDGIEPDEDGYLVVAHAVVKNGEQEETAFAKCTGKPLITLKTFFEDKTFGTPDGEEMFGDNTSKWCDWLGINIYENGDTYQLQSYGNDLDAYVEVSDDGNYLTVEVFANGELQLAHTYLYVGSMNDLVSTYVNGSCPDYSSFPYEKEETGLKHTFVIPLGESISFQDAFDISRWGWISYYNF